MSYFVMLPDQTQQGPLSIAELEAMARQGLLTGETFVWSDGWPDWVHASTVAEFGPLLNLAPAGAAWAGTAPAGGRSAGRGVLWALSLAVAAGLGFLGGRYWPPKASAPSPAEARVALDNQRLLLAAARFRGLASGRLDEALRAYGAPACLEFLRSTETGRGAPQVWAYFFSGAQVLIGHAQHARPVLAFYHPFLDAALLTRWEWSGGRPAITDAALWVGANFPGGTEEAPPGIPGWMSAARSRPMHEALLASQREFVARFDREFPIEPCDPLRFPKCSRGAEVQAFVEQHAAAQLATLLALRSHAGLGRLRRALAEGDAGALDALIPPGASFNASTLLKLPQQLRARLVPSFALASANHTIVALSLPEMPRFYLLAQFGTAEAPLEDLSVQELN